MSVFLLDFKKEARIRTFVRKVPMMKKEAKSRHSGL